MSAPLGPGSRLGSYEIIAPLDSGGMATLFLGRRLDSGAHVAIKVVRPELARDAGYVQMFIDEAKLGARLVHPNIVRTEELGQHEGIHYLAMEYVNGVTLAQLIEWLVRTRRGLSPVLAVHIAECIARALHVAHELRDGSGQLLEVIHRDISPQNILLSHRGEVKLIDFGVAKSRGRQWATMQGSLKGKLGYMSPEQALGRTIDRRTDVYALGVVLWEALTHRRLFHGATDELLARVQHPNVVSPRTLVPGLSPALDDVVMRALRPKPEDRIATAADLARQLAQSFPQASQLDVDGLSALVSLAMEDVRAKEKVDDTLRDALRVAPPTQVRTAAALAAFTRPHPNEAGESAPFDAPLTRVSPAQRPRAWRLVGVALLGLVFGAGLVGSWWTWRERDLSAAVPSPAADLSAAIPSPAAMPTQPPAAPLPVGVDIPNEPAVMPTETAAEVADPARAERRRRRREPPALPPPFIGSAGPPPRSESSSANMPPPANRPDARPRRLPPAN